MAGSWHLTAVTERSQEGGKMLCWRLLMFSFGLLSSKSFSVNKIIQISHEASLGKFF